MKYSPKNKPRPVTLFAVLFVNLITLLASDAQRTSSALVGWGANNFGELNIPAEIQGKIISVAAGGYHVVALLNDGTVRCWGAGKIKTSDHPNFGQSKPPSFSQPVLAVAAGFYHSLALLSDGTVVAWGAGSSLEDPNPSNGQATVPSELANPSTAKVVKIVAGSWSSFAVRQNGTVVGWGGLPFGLQVPPDLVGVRDLSVSHTHAIALKQDGKIVCWGNNEFEQCVIPANLPPVVQVAAGYYSSAVVLADGSMRWWGSTSNLPGLPFTPPGVAKVALGTRALVVLKTNGEVEGRGITVPLEAQNASDIAVGGTYDLSPFALALKPVKTEIAEYIEANPGATIIVDATPKSNEAGPYTYRWYFDGAAVPIAFGGAQPQITLTGIPEADGLYSVDITGSNGTTAREFVFRVRIDSDGDGLSDGREQFTYKTNPKNPDSDSDGLNDFTEVQLGTNPLAPDTDGDGYSDDYEYRTGYNPVDAKVAPDLFMTIHPSVEVRFPTAIGKLYTIEKSTDLKVWEAVESNLVGNGNMISRHFTAEGTIAQYFRTRELTIQK
jgi:hypothetical protein